MSRQVQIAQIQQVLRERYLNYRSQQDALQIGSYPNQIRSYSERQRDQFRRYWSEIVFTEFVTMTAFGNGIMKNSWATPYGDWAVDSLHNYEVLREEYCKFIRDERALGPFKEEFIAAIDSHYKKRYPENVHMLNCDALLLKRSRAISTKLTFSTYRTRSQQTQFSTT